MGNVCLEKEEKGDSFGGRHRKPNSCEVEGDQNTGHAGSSDRNDCIFLAFTVFHYSKGQRLLSHSSLEQGWSWS